MNSKLKIISLALVLLIALGAVAGPLVASENEQRSEFVAPIMIVNTSFLNVRTGPAARYSVLMTVVGGTEFPVLGVAADRVWYQVSTVAGVGWINSEFAIPRGDFGNVPVISEEDAILEALNTLDAFRDSVASDDAIANASFSGGRDWGVSIIDPHPGRSEPSIFASSFATAHYDPSSILGIEQASYNEGTLWYRVTIPDVGTGWVEADKTMMRPLACTDAFTVVTFTTDVRPSAGPDSAVTLDGNLLVTAGNEAYVLDYQNGQFKVELMDGNTGWVVDSSTSIRDNDTIRRDYCNSSAAQFAASRGSGEEGTASSGFEGPQTLLAYPRAIINTGFLNIRSGPGAQYSVVTTLSGGTEVPILGIAADGVWYLIGGDFGQGWLNNEFVIFRGDGSNLPIIREYTATTLAKPVAGVTDAVNLYAAPDVTLGLIGALSGPLELPVVARSGDNSWLQLDTPLGFGWVRANQLYNVSGDLSTVPVVTG